MVLEDTSGDMEMKTLSFVTFISIGRETGTPVAIPSIVGIGVILLALTKGSVVKLLNEYVGIISEVLNVDFNPSIILELIT